MWTGWKQSGRKMAYKNYIYIYLIQNDYIYQEREKKIKSVYSNMCLCVCKWIELTDKADICIWVDKCDQQVFMMWKKERVSKCIPVRRLYRL